MQKLQSLGGTMKQWIIDRFEENMAVLEAEDRKNMTVERSLLPNEAKEGDVIDETPDGYCLNTGLSVFRKQEMKEKMRRLFLN